MGRITSNVGLITGIPIQDTVDQLIEVSAQPRDILTSRTQGLKDEQLAVNTLATRVLSLQFELSKLKVSKPFQTRTVTSKKPEVLTATITTNGKPPLGNYSLQPVQLASAQQFISKRFESLDDIPSSGKLAFGFGGFLDKGVSLDELNDGEGVARGQIKLTDLSGNSSIIDLSLARNVDDVLAAINNDGSLNLVASVDGDSITLTDSIGGAGTIVVQEVFNGTTAADLGLAGINTSASTVTGADVYDLHSGTKLSRLNDGTGVRLQEGIDDLFFTVADGTANLSIDLGDAKTLGDVVLAINQDASLASRVSAAISADGQRLELTDLTSGGGTFSVSSGASGSAAEDLRLTGTAVGGVITGGRLLSGLKGTLVSALGGGSGLGELGSIVVTDRSGVSDTVDLSAAETLEDLVEALNASAAGISASLNKSRNGILIQDNSGGTNNLVITDGADGLQTATKLGIAFGAASDSVDSGSLNRRSISGATLLSSLNSGEGTRVGDIRIKDSSGARVSLDLNGTDTQPRTIGDVIDAINAATLDGDINVTARLNDTGDGILLIDNAGGEEKLVVTDLNGTLAKDLNLTRESESATIDDTEKQVIDGRKHYAIDLSELGALDNAIRLSSLNGGKGINLSDVRITDTKGKVLALDLNGNANISTVTDLIDEINTQAASLGVQVTASINPAGTGIRLVDGAGGTGKLVVEDINGTLAKDLNLLSTDATTTSINGSGVFSASNASQSALEKVAANFNSLEAGVVASVINDGSGYRLQLVVEETGAANEILLDEGLSGFGFVETSKAQDALLVVGGGSLPGSGVLVSSSTNQFDGVVEDVDLTVNATSETPVAVTVGTTDKDLISTVQGFIDAYNTLREELDELTVFDAEELSTGLLFGTTAALRVDTQLSRIVTDRYSGFGSFRSLEQIGISVDDAGKLELNTTKLKAAFADDPQALQNLFNATDRGVVAKFEAAIDNLTNAETGLLTSRSNSLQQTIEQNEARIQRFNDSLERERARLELQFFRLEQVLAGLQNSQQAISQIQAIPALRSTRGNTSN